MIFKVLEQWALKAQANQQHSQFLPNLQRKNLKEYFAPHQSTRYTVDLQAYPIYLINRPGVAGAVL